MSKAPRTRRRWASAAAISWRWRRDGVLPFGLYQKPLSGRQGFGRGAADGDARAARGAGIAPPPCDRVLLLLRGNRAWRRHRPAGGHHGRAGRGHRLLRPEQRYGRKKGDHLRQGTPAFPYHVDMVNELLAAAEASGAAHVLDMFLPSYSTDANVAIRTGRDVRHGLIGRACSPRTDMSARTSKAWRPPTRCCASMWRAERSLLSGSASAVRPAFRA